MVISKTTNLVFVGAQKNLLSDLKDKIDLELFDLIFFVFKMINQKYWEHLFFPVK